MSAETVHSLMSVNCYGAVLLTKNVLESFKKRWETKKTRSLLCATGAMASHGPMRLFQLYSATKIFLDRLYLALGYELSEYVDVNCWRPAGVNTNIVKGKAKNMPSVISAADFANAALSKCTAGLVHGHWQHEVAGILIDQVQDVFPWFGKYAMAQVARILEYVSK